MLVALAFLTLGIYIGQEFPNIPSVKILTLYCVEYFQNTFQSKEN